MSHNLVFAIPCKHSAAKEGVFYCLPSYYDAEHLRDIFEYLLVDTRKVIAELQTHNPYLLYHAKNKFRGTTAEKWLESMSSQYPCDMGHWSYNREVPLSMVSGQAALIKLAQEIDLPCFPVALTKTTGKGLLGELRAKVGYEDGDLSKFLVPKNRGKILPDSGLYKFGHTF